MKSDKINVADVAQDSPVSLYAKLTPEVKASNPKEAAALMRTEIEIADLALRHAQQDAPVAGRILSAITAGMTLNNTEMLEAASAELDQVRKAAERKSAMDDLRPVMQKGLISLTTLGFEVDQGSRALIDFYTDMKKRFISNPAKFEASSLMAR